MHEKYATLILTLFVFDRNMPLSAAEKQRRYRQKRDADPERRSEYLRKEKLWWNQKKSTGKVKLVAEMTDREQRQVR